MMCVSSSTVNRKVDTFSYGVDQNLCVFVDVQKTTVLWFCQEKKKREILFIFKHGVLVISLLQIVQHFHHSIFVFDLFLISEVI